MGLITYFMFEAQINYMWTLKKSKWEVFILYVVLIFPKIVYTIVCFHPFTLKSIFLFNPHKDKGLNTSKEKIEMVEQAISLITKKNDPKIK